MTDITSTIRDDLRADFGDTNEAFSDAEIDRIWTRMTDAKDDTTQYYATLALMFFQARNNAAKFHDVSVAGDSHKLSQVYDHYNKLYAEYASYLRSVLGSNQSIYRAVLQNMPRQDREVPRE